MPVRCSRRALPLLALAGSTALLVLGPPPAGAQSPAAADATAALSAHAPATPAAPDPATGSTPLFGVSPAPACNAPMCYSAQSTIYSNTRSRIHMVMTNPDITDTTRGISHITAERGVVDGPDIDDSKWVFTGNVHADMADGQMRADMATVQIVDRHIASIAAQGTPALFQRLPNNPLVTAGGAAPGPPVPSAPKAALANLAVHGHAQSITYDAAQDQVQFTGNSWFTDGCNEITSDLVTYEMASQTVRAGEKPGSKARVHGTIRNTHPGSGTGCTADSGAGGAAAQGPARPVSPAAPAAAASARAPGAQRHGSAAGTSNSGATQPGRP